ncbi:hypothetical protein BOTBODRAFT_298406 [Botryobasidium botryosum FD-172 SS1]|uniref:Uncharacterized protein n=1 Tax=Botryobasidium botryosum (strain FD-172 SS1) TaxID=930990 RepID=A0A067MU30_BOTB1|nr:hypothetical protein BOTBODRAFT_298406 [Botryobasidium botryosum FD-172 SS1]
MGASNMERSAPRDPSSDTAHIFSYLYDLLDALELARSLRRARHKPRLQGFDSLSYTHASNAHKNVEFRLRAGTQVSCRPMSMRLIISAASRRHLRSYGLFFWTTLGYMHASLASELLGPRGDLSPGRRRNLAAAPSPRMTPSHPIPPECPAQPARLR